MTALDRILPARVSLLYAILAGVYIVTSDRLLTWLVVADGPTSVLQTYKGILFVGITALLMYAFLRHVMGDVEKAQRAREHSEQVRLSLDRRNESFVQALGEIVYDHDVPRDYIEWGGDTRRPLGITCEELGHSLQAWLDRVHPDDRVRVAAELDRAGAPLYSAEYRMRHADGHYIWVFDRGVITRDDQGAMARITGVVWDITERKLASDALRDSEARFRQLAENINEVFWLSDVASGELLYVSPAYERVWGRSGADLLRASRSWLDAVHEDDRATVMSASLTRQNSGDYDLEYRIVRPDGGIRWIHDRAFPIRDATGAVYRVAGVAEDITQRKRTEVAVQERLQFERQLSRLAASAPGVIHTFKLTPDGSMSMPYCSPELVRMTGLSPADLVESVEPLFALIHKDDVAMVHESMMASRRTMELWCAEFRTGDPPHAGIWVEGRSAPVLEPDGSVQWHGFFSDITARKTLEEQLRQAQKMEAVGQLAGGIAHDFNNLLTIIIGYSDLLLTQLPPLDPHRESVDEIRRAGEQSAALTRQLLAFSRKQVLAPQVLDANDAIRRIERMLQRLIGENIELTTSLAAELGHVRVDPGQLEQLLINLVVNARDAMPDGGRVTIESGNVERDGLADEAPAAEGAGKYVRLSVTDTGTGMTDEVKRHLFEPFFTTKTAGKGTGLGLAVAHGFITQSGGHIDVVSREGGGSSFHVYFPRHSDVAPDSNASSGTALPLAPGAETVVLVEDEHGVRALARRVLLNCGYTVLEASNGIEALELCARHPTPIHLLVTDIVMPDLGGRGLTERLLVTHPNMKVIYMSGYADDAAVVDGVAEGEVNFLQKPFSPGELARKVRAVLAG